MLSYRHAYHAGNHADILKHYILYFVLNYYNGKDKPYCYFDTHAGAGFYPLNSPQAQKNAEYRTGISRLQAATHLPPALQDFLAFLQPDSTRSETYPGSPEIAARLLRDTDRLHLFERHPQDFAALCNHMRRYRFGRRLRLENSDGFHGLIRHLPPVSRRSVILTDPAYEVKTDYQTVAQTLQQALKRFATGTYLIWYPCIQQAEAAGFTAKLCRYFPQRHLYAELHICPPHVNGYGLHGSGIFILNPPYTLAENLHEVLPVLQSLLEEGQGQGAYFLQTSGE